MDYEKLIERLKHDYHGYSTVEKNPEEAFHDSKAEVLSDPCWLFK